MHNQNEMQQHGESRHVERTFLYTYVPNSDAESFLYSAGRCFYCTHVQLVRKTTVSLIQSVPVWKFFETCHTILHYVLTLFYVSRYISKWLCYNLTSFFEHKKYEYLTFLHGRLEYDTTLSRENAFLHIVDALYCIQSTMRLFKAHS